MVALVILVLTLVVSVIGFARPQVIDRCLLRPYQVAQGSGYATVLTCGLVHASIGHMIFNLFTFYSFGFRLEQVMGSLNFLVLYLTALVVSSLGTVYKHRNEPEYASLGASGAILGVLFASIVYFPRQSLYILPLPVPIPAPLFAVLYLAYSLYSSRLNRGRINHDAHISGALTGVAYVAITDPTTFMSVVGSLTR